MDPQQRLILELVWDAFEDAGISLADSRAVERGCSLELSPTTTVDAAPSSTLVTVHLACESLHRGESTLALASGVNLNISFDTTNTDE